MTIYDLRHHASHNLKVVGSNPTPATIAFFSEEYQRLVETPATTATTLPDIEAGQGLEPSSPPPEIG